MARENSLPFTQSKAVTFNTLKRNHARTLDAGCWHTSRHSGIEGGMNSIGQDHVYVVVKITGLGNGMKCLGLRKKQVTHDFQIRNLGLSRCNFNALALNQTPIPFRQHPRASTAPLKAGGKEDRKIATYKQINL